jgi:hypothetical protein
MREQTSKHQGEALKRLSRLKATKKARGIAAQALTLLVSRKINPKIYKMSANKHLLIQKMC